MNKKKVYTELNNGEKFVCDWIKALLGAILSFSGAAQTLKFLKWLGLEEIIAENFVQHPPITVC